MGILRQVDCPIWSKHGVLVPVSRHSRGFPGFPSIPFDPSIHGNCRIPGIPGALLSKWHPSPGSVHNSYFHTRILRWAGHVARMPMSRTPRQLLTGWVSHSRPIGCPRMTLGKTLENALNSKGISKDFDEWIAIAKDRSKWRQRDS